jgi:hypothetical protein
MNSYPLPVPLPPPTHFYSPLLSDHCKLKRFLPGASLAADERASLQARETPAGVHVDTSALLPLNTNIKVKSKD